MNLQTNRLQTIYKIYKRTDYSENMLQNNLDKQSTIEYWADPL